AERGASASGPVISGAYGGETIDFRRYADNGMTSLGPLRSARGGVVEIAPGLAESMKAGDLVFTGFLDIVDAYVKRRGLDSPEEPEARATSPDPRCVIEPSTQLDLAAKGINAVIWATGYGLDFGWIDIPVKHANGDPVHRDGIADIPGSYFLGSPWSSKMNSSFSSGV
ncbi:hypothetical protein OY671_010984, partial [Metschnikowia pulcherrima]